MRRPGLIIGALAVFALIVGGVVRWSGRNDAAGPQPKSVPGTSPVTPGPGSNAGTAVKPKVVTPVGVLSEAKRAKAEKIRSDYKELREKISAEHNANLQAALSPSSLTAFLQRLALLEKECHRDLAVELNEDELADYELNNTGTGEAVRKLLDGTAADDLMRRAAFKLQRQFDLDYGYTFDLSAPALLKREQAHQATFEAVRAVLGDEIFSEWLRRSDKAYGRFAALAEQQQQKGVELELWKAKNEFTVQYLTIRTSNPPADALKAQVATLRLQSESRVAAIIGAGGVQRGGRAVFDWLQSGAGPVR